MPSRPTASSGGTSRPPTKISSTHIWVATTTCAATMIRLPSIGFDADPVSADGKMTPSRPTSSVPTTTASMPIQWWPARRRFMKIREIAPVKSTTLPRSIWKSEA